PALVIAIFAGGLSIQTAVAQTPVSGLVPHVDLNASLDAGPDQHKAGDIAAGLQVLVPSGQKSGNSGKLFNDPPAEEKGWKGLARLLEALTPSIDTALPLSASQITDRISNMLDQGQNQEALQVIEKRMAQLEEKGGMGTDVQLLFLHGR